MDEFPSVRVEGCCDNVHRNSVVIDVILYLFVRVLQVFPPLCKPVIRVLFDLADLADFSSFPVGCWMYFQ